MWAELNPKAPICSQKHCDRQKANLRIRFKPSLFQHVGTHSSLAGKIQKLKVRCGTRCGQNVVEAGVEGGTHAFYTPLG